MTVLFARASEAGSSGVACNPAVDYDNPTYVARAVALGASGYVLKSDSRERLLESIDIAMRGDSAWTRDELRRVTGALATPRLQTDVEVPLTQR